MMVGRCWKTSLTFLFAELASFSGVNWLLVLGGVYHGSCFESKAAGKGFLFAFTKVLLGCPRKLVHDW